MSSRLCDRSLTAISCLLILMAVWTPSTTAQVPADAVFRDFEPTGDFLFELGGKDLEHAEVYHSQRAVAYLIVAPELSSPVLVNPRMQSVESVNLMKVSKQPDGSIDLLADAAFNRLGGFQVKGQEVVFQVKGESAKLKPKPPLLGFHKPETLKTNNPKYARLAESYNPAATHLSTLRGQDARVLIYFGTWCPTCGRLVPRMLRVEDELQGAKLEFQYYGLPPQMSDDPVTKRDDVHGVPTGIVYVGDKEVGRLGVKELQNPEASLARLLAGG